MYINKHLFAAYCGMIKSGYDLMDLSDEIVAKVCEWIYETDFDDDIIEYFRFAKTNKILINPYYPRGSDLSAACFFLGKSLDEYIEFLQLCESPEANNAQFTEWISELPGILERIECKATFGNIFQYYCEVVEERFLSIPEQLEGIEGMLKCEPFCTPISLRFAPNLLQLKFLADYALVGDTLYVISGTFQNSAVIHEYLHIALKPIRGILLDVVQRYSLNTFVDVGRMLELGYLRGDSNEELAHTLEECLVRALCGVIDQTLDIEEYCQMNIQSGFYSMPEVMKSLLNFSWSDMTLAEIVLKAVSIAIQQ